MDQFQQDGLIIPGYDYELLRNVQYGSANVSAEKEVKKLKKRKPSFRGSLLTKTKVMDTIGAIFEKKARADTIRVSKLKPRVSLAQSARDFFVQMYGTIGCGTYNC